MWLGTLHSANHSGTDHPVAQVEAHTALQEKLGSDGALGCPKDRGFQVLKAWGSQDPPSHDCLDDLVLPVRQTGPSHPDRLGQLGNSSNCHNFRTYGEDCQG